MVREEAEGAISRSRTLPARMYRRWAAALSPRSLAVRLSLGPPHWATGRFKFPAPLAAPRAHLPLSSRLRFRFRNQHSVGLIVEKGATLPVGARAPRTASPSSGLQHARRPWRGLAGSLTRCKGSRLRRDWDDSFRGARCAEIEGAKYTLIRPCPLDQRPTALTIALSSGESQCGDEVEAHTVTERASDA